MRLASMKIGDYLDLDLDLDLDWEWEMMSSGKDVLDMLPSDPFEMGINGGCTMITGWIEEVETRKDDDMLFSGLNLVWTEATRIIGDEIDVESNGLFMFDRGKDSGHGKVLYSINESNASCCDFGVDCDDDVDDDDVGSPPDALFFALGYLGMRDLLSVESVCKSLRDGVRNDPLLWRSIYVDQPPGDSFVDDSLLRMTNRANGRLQCLSLVKCLKITDNGLKSVFQRNPGLTKLSVLGCNGLSVEGLVRNLNALKSSGGAGIKRLRIGGLHTVTIEQFEELKKALSIDNQKPLGSPKPRLYHGGQLHLSLDDDRPIDIEACPKCHQLRQVYDCPTESCACRACTFCIPRCINCGCCFNERDYMETFCLDFLCLDCLTRILSFPDGEDEEEEDDMGIASGFRQQASYHFCLYG